jgi:hypothetical protein
MISIRNGTFETNSSSTHSMVICLESDYKKWEDGEAFYYKPWRSDDGEPRFITKREAIDVLVKHGRDRSIMESLSDEDLFEYFTEEDIYTYENWGEGYEHDSDSFTTPGGERVVVDCYYGYDY